MKVVKVTKNEELFNKVLSYEVKWAKATSNKMANKALEDFSSIEGNDLVTTIISEKMECGIAWVVDGETVLASIPTTDAERHLYAENDAKVVSGIHQHKIELDKKRMKKDEANADSLKDALNNLRTRNSELISKVGKMKGEINSANDRIAELEKMLELATLKIAELEDANEELSIYKEMVEDETRIEE